MVNPDAITQAVNKTTTRRKLKNKTLKRWPNQYSDTLPSRKRKAVADELLANPKQPVSQAVAKHYNATTPQSRASIGSAIMRDAKVMRYLQKHSQQAELTLIDIMNNSDDTNRRLSAESILDRVYGKATSRSINATVNIEQLLSEIE